MRNKGGRKSEFRQCFRDDCKYKIYKLQKKEGKEGRGGRGKEKKKKRKGERDNSFGKNIKECFVFLTRGETR